MIATDVERDVAILQLDYLREGALAIDHDSTTDLSLEMIRNDVVHILGNPGGLKLWRWTLGLFQYPVLGNPLEGTEQQWTPELSELEDTDWLQISASTHGGNSGGPVLNGYGELVGVLTLGDDTTSWISPVRYITELLDTVLLRPTIQISNNTDFPMSYELRWSDADDWEPYFLEAYDISDPHWPDEAFAERNPEIRFNSDGEPDWEPDVTYSLNPFLRYFGDNYVDHVDSYDAAAYQFEEDILTGEITLSPISTDGCGQPLDVDGDGEVNLQDLAYIESQFGLWGDEETGADLNGDDIVNTADLIYAAGLACDAFAAPTLHPHLTPTITAERVQRWIDEGKALGRDEPTYQRGIAALENLLAIIKRTEAIPKQNVLLPNYPNPFNPETWIPYELSEPATVTVTIYAADGRVVRELQLGQQPAGIYQKRAERRIGTARTHSGSLSQPGYTSIRSKRENSPQPGRWSYASRPVSLLTNARGRGFRSPALSFRRRGGVMVGSWGGRG